MTYKEKLESTLSVQELIDVLMTVEDKSQKVLIEAYPECDDCVTYIPIAKTDICRSDFDVRDKDRILKTTIEAGYNADEDWFTDEDANWEDDEDEELDNEDFPD